MLHKQHPKTQWLVQQWFLLIVLQAGGVTFLGCGSAGNLGWLFVCFMLGTRLPRVDSRGHARSQCISVMSYLSISHWPRQGTWSRPMWEGGNVHSAFIRSWQDYGYMLPSQGSVEVRPAKNLYSTLASCLPTLQPTFYMLRNPENPDLPWAPGIRGSAWRRWWPWLKVDGAW